MHPREPKEPKDLLRAEKQEETSSIEVETKEGVGKEDVAEIEEVEVNSSKGEGMTEDPLGLSKSVFN